MRVYGLGIYGLGVGVWRRDRAIKSKATAVEVSPLAARASMAGSSAVETWQRLRGWLLTPPAPVSEPEAEAGAAAEEEATEAAAAAAAGAGAAREGG